ncbi:MAG: flagellar motor protein MotB [Bdellovibrionales bacterium]
MADDGVVIKKITIVDGGGHGGAWKVAFADFMTAMMAFFLVMWLLSQDSETKANIASYFSGPSMLEHDYTSYGARLTMEKLFLDLVNEPLDTLQNMLEPPDFTPDVLAMGSKGVILHHVAENLGEVAENVNVTSDTLVFEIKDYYLFQMGTSNFSGQFTEIIKQVSAVTEGMEDTIVEIESEIFVEQLDSKDPKQANIIATQRARLLKKYVEGTFESEGNEVQAKAVVKKAKSLPPSGKPPGTIRFVMKKKAKQSDGSKPRKIESIFGERDVNENIYDDFVKRVSDRKKKELIDDYFEKH